MATLRPRAPRAPLTPSYREAPLWLDDAGLPAAARAARPLPERADVVIVGGGYLGAVAAWQLARRGRHAVVVEADELGTGASCRNGGMVLPELKHGPRALTRAYGPLGGELVDAVLDAFAAVEQVVADGPIDCGYARTGALLLAHHPRALAELRAAERELVDDLGQDARVVTGDDLRAEIGTDAYTAGLLTPLAGGLQPAQYHAGLVRLALDAGAELHGHTRALVVAPHGARVRVGTDRGTVDAGDVLVATNAYADELVPALARRVLPVGSFIVATEVLDPDVAAAISPRGRMFFDTKHFLFYWRLSPDRRMVFGGRTRLAPTTVERARDVLYREMVRIHPQLRGVALERAWGGNVAITMDRLPHCGRLDGVAYATGCNGTGVALATWFGMRAAAWLVGEEPPPAFAELAFRPVPLRSLRGAYLPVVGEGLRALDRLGR